jgi:glycosyltransferase involved in cell wall biosynthesis
VNASQVGYTKSPRKPGILFFVPEWPALDSSILHAQVLSVASFLNREGFSCQFAGAETSPARAQEAVTAITAQYKVRAFVRPALALNAGAWDNWRSCRRVYGHICSEVANAGITYVYARSFIGSMWARRLARRLKAVSIFDVRGLVGLEKQLLMGPSMKSRLLSYLELYEARRADRLSTVSKNLKQYLSRKIGREDTTVIPSCFNENSFYFEPAARKEIRNAFGLNENSILLCYSGGMSAWQRLPDIISLLKKVCSADHRCKALFLTNNQGELASLLREAEFPSDQTFIHGCSHKEVHRYLSAADLGFIMRHDTTVNNVASPVKVAEYLACGLPVILTRGIGDYSDMLPDAGVGVLVDETADIVDQVLNFIHENNSVSLRNKAIRFARSRLTMSANLDRYRSLYAVRQATRLRSC